MIYKERMTVEEVMGRLSQQRSKSKKHFASCAFVFPYINKELSKEEEEKLASVVSSLTKKIRQKA